MRVRAKNWSNLSLSFLLMTNYSFHVSTPKQFASAIVHPNSGPLPTHEKDTYIDA